MESNDSPIFQVSLSRLGFEEALQACEARVSDGAGGFVCFANVHSVTESRSNEALKKALNNAFLSVADGLPLVWASRLKASPIGGRVCGPDFMTEWLRRNPQMRYGFMGGSPGQAEELVQRFKLTNAVTYCPPMRPFSRENVIEDWNQFSIRCGNEPPSVVWVGLGAPKQELWMDEAARLAPGVLFFGVGAAFDFLTLRKQRAPLWMQKAGLEWLFRLIREPKRLWKRYLKTNSLFIFWISWEILGKRLKN